jgi:hypothetical protein
VTSTPEPETEGELDCVSCGACCFSIGPGYVQLSGKDHARLSEGEQNELTQWLGNRVFMRMDAGRCNALRVDENGGFPCSIYERRPQICQDLEQGGDACLNDRERVLRGSGTCARMRADLLRGVDKRLPLSAQPPRAP